MSSEDQIATQKTFAGKSEKGEKPNLPKWLFWDVRYEEMDWHRSSQYVIQRILDRGNDLELAELVRFYGRRKVLHVLKKKPIYLMDHSIERACTFFKVKPEELLCYMRKRSRLRHWL
jgi:hypothetical protein